VLSNLLDDVDNIHNLKITYGIIAHRSVIKDSIIKTWQRGFYNTQILYVMHNSNNQTIISQIQIIV